MAPRIESSASRSQLQNEAANRAASEEVPVSIMNLNTPPQFGATGDARWKPLLGNVEMPERSVGFRLGSQRQQRALKSRKRAVAVDDGERHGGRIAEPSPYE